MLREHRDADRERHRTDVPAVVRHVHLRDRLTDLLGSLRGVLAGCAREHERELLTAHPTRDVGTARLLAEEAPDRREDAIARLMAERVVELLEEVDVHHEHADRRRLTRPALDLSLERLVGVAAIVETGERIADRLVPQALAQAQVRERHPHLLTDDHRPALDLLGIPVLGDVERPDHLPVRQQRQTEHRRLALARVLAPHARVALLRPMWLSAPKRPAGVGTEGLP